MCTTVPTNEISRKYEEKKVTETMFLPKSANQIAQENAEHLEMKRGIERVERWALNSIPENLRRGVLINVSEVQCGDPNCSPIDTSIILQFKSGGRGVLGIPSQVKDVTSKDLDDIFPPDEILEKWHKGEDAEWPPFDESFGQEELGGPPSNLPRLRFGVGQRVQCRISPDPVTGWANGEVIQLWYKEKGWPPGSWAPYKVTLDDGRKIFAPGDVDEIIRAL